jgi:dihydrofolate reductase
MTALPRLVLIAALDRGNAIGRDNQLPWHLPDDLRHFKALTMGQPLLMGRRTAESLGRALPGRLNLVLTRGDAVPFVGMQPVPSLRAALLAAVPAPELWVIGGGELYRLCLPYAERLHLTEVDTRIDDGDVFFPRVDPAQWQELSHSEHPADARHAHAFRMRELVRRAPPTATITQLVDAEPVPAAKPATAGAWKAP